jgi:hypothetical protein
MTLSDKKKTILLVVVLVVVVITMLLLAISCSCNDKPFHGYIVDKEFIPEHRERRGKRHHVTVPDSYVIYVANKTGVKKFDVSEYKFEKLHKGDTITIK